MIAYLLVMLAVLGGAASADEIVLPHGPLKRGQALPMTYRLDGPGTGQGVLGIEWTDALGRLVDRHTIRFKLAGTADVPFTLDGRRAVAMQNELHVHLSFDDGTHRRERELSFSFIVSPVDAPWSDYQIIMWQPHTAPQNAVLKKLGVTAGQVPADRDDPASVAASATAPLLANDMPWFVENIATDFYSAYHRWFPDRPVNWRFLAAQDIYRLNPDDPAALRREPSLSDPRRLARIRERLIATVRAHRRFRPLYYNLADEPGIADLAAFWDFDFSAPSLAGMRQWLMGQYGSLAALNAEWGTHAASWAQVMPETTRQAMRRGDGNFASWVDFKTWMDVAFARAIRAGTDAVHTADGAAYAAIEGGQVPGWGGYDYTLLAKSVDIMELYDEAAADIVRSLNPGMIMLSTSNERGAREVDHVWRRLLDGERGLIIWDDKKEYAGRNGSPGQRGLAAAPALEEIRRGIGALLINSIAATDPVAVLYSPASMRVQWMLDWQPHGEAWSHRGSDVESDDNTSRSATGHYVKLLRQLAVEPHFVSPEQVESGELKRAGYRIIFLPHAVVLSDAEAGAFRAFVKDGGVIVADVEPGAFDRHGRRRAKPLLSDLFAGNPAGNKSRKGRAVLIPIPDPQDDQAIQAVRRWIETAGVKPGVDVTGPNHAALHGVEFHRFRQGNVLILALQRDLSADAARGEGASVEVTLPHQAFVYDIRGKSSLGSMKRLTASLDGVEPKLFALSERELPGPAILRPRQARLGDTVDLTFHLSGTEDASAHVFHLDVVDP